MTQHDGGGSDESKTFAARRKARLVHSQIAELSARLGREGVDDGTVQRALAPYFKLLDQLYEEELPIAKARDVSDLLMHIEGPTVDERNPRASLVTAIIGDVRTQVGKVTRAIAEISGALEQGKRLPKEIDLNLTAFARGSLYLGFALPDPSRLYEEDGSIGLLGADDPIYKSTKEALAAIGVVARHVSGESFDIEALEYELPDLIVRDTALAAVKHFSPSSRRGTSAVSLGGKSVMPVGMARLSEDSRSRLSATLRRPLGAAESTQFVGVIREIDLDTRRFELRQLLGVSEKEVRCAYGDHLDSDARRWLDKAVHVAGAGVRDKGGRIQMMEVESLQVVPRGERLPEPE